VVIPATWVAKAGRSQVQGPSGQFSENLYQNKKYRKRAGSLAQWENTYLAFMTFIYLFSAFHYTENK
jgi:hypothetical protein